MTRYTIHSGDEFHGDSSYQVLRGLMSGSAGLLNQKTETFIVTSKV